MSQPILNQFVSKEQVATMRLRRCWWPGRGGTITQWWRLQVTRCSDRPHTGTLRHLHTTAGRCFEISDQRDQRTQRQIWGDCRASSWPSSVGAHTATSSRERRCYLKCRAVNEMFTIFGEGPHKDRQRSFKPPVHDDLCGHKSQFQVDSLCQCLPAG